MESGSRSRGALALHLAIGALRRESRETMQQERQEVFRNLEARYGTEKGLGVWWDEEEEVSYLADGRRLAACTDCARFIRDREPNTRIVGYLHDDNPSAASELAFGHDFAIVDERFIVDPWVVIIAGESIRAVFRSSGSGRFRRDHATLWGSS